MSTETNNRHRKLMAGGDGFVLRPLRLIEEYRQCEGLQRRVWDFSNDLDVIPASQLVAAQKAGGIVLGAFDELDRVRGFCYGFLGRDRRGRTLHYSQMTAVDDDLRSRGIGAAVKWAQRDAALEQGLGLMSWTFDPLESRNANFNFNRLGIVAEEYYSDLYGVTTSPLHRGTATDRFVALWHLLSARVEKRRAGEHNSLCESLEETRLEVGMALLGRPTTGSDGNLLAPDEPRLDLEEPCVVCEIPASIQDIKSVDLGLAVAWREATREVLAGYLKRGYYVREFVRTVEKRSRALYLLEHGLPGDEGLED